MNNFNFNGLTDNIILYNSNIKTNNYISKDNKGKFYCEFTLLNNANVSLFGVINEKNLTTAYENNAISIYFYTGLLFPSQTSYLSRPVTKDDVFGILIDTINNNIAFSLNGVIGPLLTITSVLGIYEKLYFAVMRGTSNPGTNFNVNFGKKAFRYKPDGYLSVNSIYTDHIISKDSKLYSIADNKYNITTKSYDNITITADSTIENIYKNNNVALRDLFIDKNINNEIFKPIDKLIPFKINKLKS